MARKKWNEQPGRRLIVHSISLSILFAVFMGGATRTEAGIRNPALFAVSIPIFALTFGVIGTSLFWSQKKEVTVKSSITPTQASSASPSNFQGTWTMQNTEQRALKELRLFVNELSALELQATSQRPLQHDNPIPLQ
jgi:hypothetical protein